MPRVAAARPLSALKRCLLDYVVQGLVGLQGVLGVTWTNHAVSRPRSSSAGPWELAAASAGQGSWRSPSGRSAISTTAWAAPTGAIVDEPLACPVMGVTCRCCVDAGW